jgi:hypothetical protein
MWQLKVLPSAAVLLGALALTGLPVLTAPAFGQADSCPYGYYYVAGYGCAPLSFADPSVDVLPDTGFGFFYGGGWGRGGYRGGTFHGGGAFHGGGGGFHGGGGGFHGGGGGHGGHR